MRLIHGRSLPVRAVRRAVAPAALEMAGALPELRGEQAALRAELAELRAALEGLRAENEQLRREVAELSDGLHEARRLNLRVAEVTDLVTELVLPLHDRDVDPAALRRLRADTL